MEAPLTENIWQVYQDQPVVIIGAGSDWGQPYSCEEWAYTFGLSYPLLDDSDGNVYDLFGTGYIPHNVIIDHQGVVLYSQSGFNSSVIVNIIMSEKRGVNQKQNSNEIINKIKELT